MILGSRSFNRSNYKNCQNWAQNLKNTSRKSELCQILSQGEKWPFSEVKSHSWGGMKKHPQKYISIGKSFGSNRVKKILAPFLRLLKWFELPCHALYSVKLLSVSVYKGGTS